MDPSKQGIDQQAADLVQRWRDAGVPDPLVLSRAPDYEDQLGPYFSSRWISHRLWTAQKNGILPTFIIGGGQRGQAVDLFDLARYVYHDKYKQHTCQPDVVVRSAQSS